MDEAFYYRYCGLALRSAIALPGLAPLVPPPLAAPDIEIAFGRAEKPAEPVRETALLTIGAEGAALIDVADVARIRIDSGAMIVVEPRPAADPAAIGVFVAGMALGLLAHQREMLPLHGALLRVGGKGLVLTGGSGAGKSTLALWLAKRGHTVLGDDICLVEDGPVAWAPSAAVKLWDDAVVELGLAPSSLRLMRRGSAKHVLTLDASRAAAPAPLHAILRLVNDKRANGSEIAWLSGAEALDRLLEATYRLPAAIAMGRWGAIARRGLALLADGGLKVGTLRRPMAFEAMDAAAAAIEAALER